MFERFNEDARGVVVDAQLQTRRLGHDYLGCEHFLLAIVSTDTEVGGVFRDAGVTSATVERAVARLVGNPTQAIDREALAAIGIDLDLVRRSIEAAFGPNAWLPPAQRRRRRRWRPRGRCESGYGAIPLTARAKKCLELSLGEAQRLGHHHIGIEHLALALTAMREGVIPELLSTVGVSGAEIRARILDRYRQAG